jgi:hypothetical protein
MLRLSRDKHETELDVDEFREILLECIDQGLLVLGESPREAIYYHLEKRNLVRKDEIPEKLEDFIEGLRRIFGPGSSLIEKQIIQELFRKFDVTTEEDCSDLLKSVRFVMKLLASKKSRRTR